MGATMDRFWSKVDRSSGRESCWPWTACTTRRGYGRYSYKEKMLSSHRVSYELTYGSIPDGLCVCHRCDNPSCVNPSHLFLGTHTDNMRDKIKKGRSKSVAPKGEKNGQAKLTESQVLTIRTDTRTQRVIAKDFGICQSSVMYIKSGLGWKHVL